ncbi:MAG: aldo/keto reductase [Defluviitaleaceae bacterium]|nr:aldo/keto reductase [Defluviitaleaceae bacterium]
MKSLKDTYTLCNGVKIPCVGFGTWQIPEGETVINPVKAALSSGYVHIDTAAAYGNETGVGEGIRQSGVDRKDLFIATKLPTGQHGYENTMATFKKSMERLGIETLDLYLVHWPNPINVRDHWRKALQETWRAFEELYEAGKIRAIGLCNSKPHHIEAVLETAKIAPMINQIHLCPGDPQTETVEYCKSKNILIEAYSPLGVGKIFEVPEVAKLAKKYGRTVAQVCIRWSLQQGYLPLPKSVTPSRIAENTQVFDFELENEDIGYLAGLTGCAGYGYDPDSITW